LQHEIQTDPLPLLLEHWKPIIGYEDLYCVSNTGKIKRLAGSYGCNTERFVKPRLNVKGYQAVQLWRGNKPKHAFVHNLVAETFLGHRPPGHEPNHKDRVRTNCRASNLEYLTHQQNLRFSASHGVYRGENGSNVKVTESIVRQIRTLKGTMSAPKIGEMVGLSRSQVTAIQRREKWAHVV
jgi:HNH endonuclease/NUMOD4 motif